MQNIPYSPTNQELVSRCLAGDATAWEKLVERYARLVRSVPARYRLGQDDIDDITQDVFLALARSLHRLENPEALGKWLLVTARHRSWRIAQKAAKEQPTADGSLPDDPNRVDAAAILAIGPGIGELTELWSQREILSYGLEKLDQRCQRLLYMLFLDPEEPSYDHISHKLAMAMGSIGPIRQRCLDKLRTILEELGDVRQLLQ